ncbi:transposase [Streptomyces sp. NPDC014724]|uniref:transposase n=1 Tax=unclassified Streptomyces TaxID=2593676 RepID=UPI0036FF64A6
MSLKSPHRPRPRSPTGSRPAGTSSRGQSHRPTNSTTPPASSDGPICRGDPDLVAPETRITSFSTDSTHVLAAVRDLTRLTSSREGAWNVGFPPRELRDLQVCVRTEQQTPDWKARYAVRSGVEGTINEFAHRHGMRHCRYRGQPKAHLQHVLTAIAVNIERLRGRSDTEQTPSQRPPTAFQTFLDQHDIPRSKSWRTLGS